MIDKFSIHLNHETKLEIESPNIDKYNEIPTFPTQISCDKTAIFVCHVQIHPAWLCINHIFIVLCLSEKPRAWKKTNERADSRALTMDPISISGSSSKKETEVKIISFLRNLLSFILESGHERLSRHLENTNQAVPDWLAPAAIYRIQKTTLDMDEQSGGFIAPAGAALNCGIFSSMNDLRGTTVRTGSTCAHGRRPSIVLS